MLASVQFGEIAGLVVVEVQEMPCTPGVTGRWWRDYSTRADAAWDLERLALLPPSTAAALKAFPTNQQLPALAAYIRDPKETMRSFQPLPFTHEQ